MAINEGIRKQQQLNVWFNALLSDTSNFTVDEKGARLERLEKAIRRIRELVASGWRLRMSSEKSPADKAGIDLLWEDEPTGRWFALDCSLKEKMGLPRLIHLVRIKNDIISVGSVISLATKTIFLELLIELTEGRAILNRGLIAPPSIHPVADINLALRDFQRQLRALRNHAYGDLFLEWSENLGGAIGYAKKMKTQSGQVDMENIQRVIEEGVQTYLAASLQNNGELARPKLKFTRKLLSYSETSDTVILADRGNPHVRGIKVMVQQAFDSALLERLAKAGKMTDKLMAVKRNFSASGYAWVINHLLDVLEAERLGITHTVSLPGQRKVSTTQDGPSPKAQSKAKPPVSTGLRTESARIVTFEAGNGPLAAYTAFMQKRKEARAR